MELLEFTWPDISDTEAEKWLNGLGAQDFENELIALTIMTLFRKPPSIIDIGSGTGCLANVWRRNGIDAYGIDRLPRKAWGHLYQADLTKPIVADRTFAMVTCIEVAEHLPETAADTLCDTLSGLCDTGGLLILTAAQPGQGGDGHINCQPAEYWRKKLTDRGMVYSDCSTYRTMLALRAMDHALRHIEANLQVFKKG